MSSLSKGWSDSPVFELLDGRSVDDTVPEHQDLERGGQDASALRINEVDQPEENMDQTVKREGLAAKALAREAQRVVQQEFV